MPVEKRGFKVDTHRPRSKSKMRSKIRHVLAVASGMFPTMAAFVYVMYLLQTPRPRSLLQLAVVFLACGMVSLLFYAWARAEKLRRREVSAANREKRYRRREEAYQRERERGAADASGAKGD